jgi:hypothetical protein
MNAELITHEAHVLLNEVAGYEEPRLFLDEAPTLSDIAKKASSRSSVRSPSKRQTAPQRVISNRTDNKGHIKDIMLSDKPIKDRQEAILSVIKSRGRASIKDISTIIRGVSEKTVQRELLTLISVGKVSKQGERRWSTYSLA